MILPEGEVRVGGRAALYVFGQLGWPFMGVLALPPMIWFIELGYRLVARNRIAASKLFFRHDHDEDPG